MNNIKLSDGIVVFVEANNSGEWFMAKDWQKEKFIEIMEFGTMKTMGYPNPYTESQIFIAPNKYEYKFHIYNDWGPVYIENINTKKKREIKYFELFKNDSKTNPNFEYKLSNIIK